MQITRLDDQAILLSQIDAVLTELLRDIAPSANPSGNQAAKRRLFSAPSEDENEEDLLHDWQEYVEPELKHLFRSTLQVIGSDLQKLHVDPKTGESSISIPGEHLEKWIHGLNQARLVLAAKHEFGEDEMERILPLAGDPRSMALLQVRFYGVLQELFLRELDGE